VSASPSQVGVSSSFFRLANTSSRLLGRETEAPAEDKLRKSRREPRSPKGHRLKLQRKLITLEVAARERASRLHQPNLCEVFQRQASLDFDLSAILRLEAQTNDMSYVAGR
jgi:hypothetical protein